MAGVRGASVGVVRLEGQAGTACARGGRRPREAPEPPPPSNPPPVAVTAPIPGTSDAATGTGTGYLATNDDVDNFSFAVPAARPAESRSPSALVTGRLGRLPVTARVKCTLRTVRIDAEDAMATVDVTATGAAPVSDTNALVIFKEGFDVPYGDGTQDVGDIVDE